MSDEVTQSDRSIAAQKVASNSWQKLVRSPDFGRDPEHIWFTVYKTSPFLKSSLIR